MTRNDEMKRVNELINADGAQYIFACNDIVHALGLIGVVDDLTVVTYDNSPIVEGLRHEGVRVELLENVASHFDKLKTTKNLVAHDFFKDVTESLPGEKRLMVFKNSKVVEGRANELGLRLLASGANISRWVENKVAFYEALLDEDVNLVPGEVVSMDDSVSYGDIAKKYGDKIVLQAAKGFAGAKTFCVRSEEDFNSLKQTYKNRKMRLTKYISGETVTVNACATRLGTVVKPPFRQLTGIPELTQNEMGACGNDYYIDDLGVDIITEIVGSTKRIGELIYEKGYKGFFGVDYIVSGGSVYFIECNPRFVTSLPMFTRLELANGEVPLIAFHLLELLGKIESVSDIINKEKTYIGYSGAQIILHNLHKKTKKIKSDMRSGIYNINAESPVYVREGFYVDDIESSDEVLIVIKPKEHEINSNMECARIITKQRALEDGRLTDGVRALINNIYNELM